MSDEPCEDEKVQAVQPENQPAMLERLLDLVHEPGHVEMLRHAEPGLLNINIQKCMAREGGISAA